MRLAGMTKLVTFFANMHTYTLAYQPRWRAQSQRHDHDVNRASVYRSTSTNPSASAHTHARTHTHKYTHSLSHTHTTVYTRRTPSTRSSVLEGAPLALREERALHLSKTALRLRKRVSISSVRRLFSAGLRFTGAAACVARGERPTPHQNSPTSSQRSVNQRRAEVVFCRAV